MIISFQDRLERPFIDRFVTLARQCFPGKYPAQDFDASRWDMRHLLKSASRKSDKFLYFVRYRPGMTKKNVTQAEPLPAYFSDVVKSLLLLHPNTLLRVRLTSFRLLWEELLERFGEGGSTFRWYLLRETDVRKTEQRMREVWTDTTVYTSINGLIVDLRRLAERNIVARLNIVPATPCPKQTHRHTLEGNEAALVKLPTRSVLNGLADIYAKHAVDPPDRLLADVLAILAVTGLRIDEVLTLSSDCLITRTLNGREYFGLRISKRKSPGRAEEDHVLWLTPLQASIVLPAVQEARTITDPAREQAKKLEQNPTRIPLQGVGWSDKLSSREVADLIGYSSQLVINRISKEALPRRKDGNRVLYSVVDVERYLLSRRKDLWMIKRADGSQQMLSESLFVVFENFFGTAQGGKGSRRLLRLLVEPVTQQQIRTFLTGVHLKDGRVQQRSAFERFDIRDTQTGEVFKMNPHQCRHWITHNAVRGGIPISDMARWHGRENVDDVFTYTHMTSNERLEWLKSKFGSGDLKGPFVDYYFSLADDVKDFFLDGRLGAIHITHMGLCLHEFTVRPCPKKLACLSGKGCPEYVFDSSDAKQRTNLVQIIRRTSSALEQAEAKVGTPGMHFAESWVQDLSNTRDNAERILSSTPGEGTSLVRPFAEAPTQFQPIGE